MRSKLAAGAKKILVVMIAMFITAGIAMAQTDSAASQSLTDYLRAHRFPLVGASVTHPSNGGTQVMLYGYVATDAGKANAASIVANYYHNDPSVTVINRIAVNPEIRDLSSNTSSSAAATGPSPYGNPTATYGQANGSGGGITPQESSWEQVYQEIQKYGIHAAPDPSNPSTPW
jgi:hypothetical protein